MKLNPLRGKHHHTGKHGVRAGLPETFTIFGRTVSRHTVVVVISVLIGLVALVMLTGTATAPAPTR